MEVFQPIIHSPTKSLLITEPYCNFLCTWCNKKDFCVNADNCNNLFVQSNIMNLIDFDDVYISRVFTIIEANKDNIKNIICAISEFNLGKYRKQLHYLSKALFDYSKSLTQILFTNTSPQDLIELKSSYKYLTYVDVLMQNYKPTLSNDSELSCLFNKATYISLIDFFSTGKIVYKNL